MRIPLIAGNWKMHKTEGEARALVRALKSTAANPPHCQVVVAPPFTALSAVAGEIRGTSLLLAAQNVHWEPNGAFTGEISIPMLEDLGCQMVILGHSERRQYFGETDAMVNRRTRAVVKSSLQAIMCIGENLSERQAGNYQKVIFHQLAGGLDGLTARELSHIILAYEPVWAIGTGHTASPEIAQEVHGGIRDWLFQNFGNEAGQAARIVYGGSVKPENISDLMRQPDIDGALVGGACLEAESFLSIIYYRS